MIKLLFFSVLTSSLLFLSPKWLAKAPDGQWINWVALSADGTRAATGTYKPNTLDTYKYYLFDNNGKILFEDTFKDYQNGVFSVSMSEDGKYGVIGGTRKSKIDVGFDVGFLKAYNHDTKKVILDVDTVGRTTWIDQSSDGSKMVAGSRNLQFFSLEDGTYKLIHNQTSKSSYRSLAMSADGEFTIAGTAEGVAEVYSFKNNEVKKIFSWNADPIESKQVSIQSVAMDRAGRFFAVTANNGKMYYFSVDSKSQQVDLVWEVESPIGNNIYGVTVSEDGHWVAMGTSANYGDKPGEKLVQIYKNVCVINTCHGEFYWQFETDKAPNPGMQFDKKVNWLVVATGYPVGKPGSFYLIDVPNKEIKMQHVVKDMSWPVTISRDGKAIFGGSDSGEIFYFENSFQ